MQRMIMIPVDQYEKMLESYDKAVEELMTLKNQLEKMKIDSAEERREVLCNDLSVNR